MRAWCVVAFAAVAACVRPGAYHCASDGECTLSGRAGTCEINGYCSFPDGSCSDGRRFGAQSGDVSGQCVGANPGIDGHPSDGSKDRVTSDLVALYTFDEGTGTTARDSSGVAPALDLQLGTSTAWVAGGLQIGAGATATASAAGAAKITNTCVASGQVTFEVWIQSASAAMTSAERIFGVASTNNTSACSIGQEGTAYYGQIRTSTTSTKLPSPDATSTTSLVHVVHTRAVGGDRNIYLDGVVAATVAGGGNLSNWDVALPVTVGNSLDGGLLWEGKIFLAAVYCRALTAAEVAQNFAAGP